MLHRLANDDNRVFFITEREGRLLTGKTRLPQSLSCLGPVPPVRPLPGKPAARRRFGAHKASTASRREPRLPRKGIASSLPGPKTSRHSTTFFMRLPERDGSHGGAAAFPVFCGWSARTEAENPQEQPPPIKKPLLRLNGLERLWPQTSPRRRPAPVAKAFGR